jgi:hypothetical protein
MPNSLVEIWIDEYCSACWNPDLNYGKLTHELRFVAEQLTAIKKGWA